jgi:hypothetical protein
MTPRGRVGVYPGSFNPPTIAHLGISSVARRRHDLDRIVWSVSRVALAKEVVDHPRFEHRIEVLEHVASTTPWLDIRVTEAQLLVDVADGFDLLVMGADKWTEIQRVEWYEDVRARDAAIAALPPVAIAPRPPHEVPTELVLDVDEILRSVSSSRARAGALDLMLPAARDFALRTGAWLDRDRYEQWAEPFSADECG